ncbi:hypothetical protein HU200_010269 [Digitaria exilis]|uniref:RNase H type-1 domain-containing protein n=1 Tax=Digitaria exilis TaxID=1010633 RepID=A0A835FIA8_9POAL|nr:hypothetical protein HU200_010269 [Digitaria exilis]
MRQKWLLPPEEDLKYSGPEWLLRVIDGVEADSAGCLLLVLWRAWFVRNELTHSNRKQVIESSVSFLENYWETLCGISRQGLPDSKGDASIGVVIRDEKGKVLLTAWRVVSNAANAEEVELMACKEGITLAAEWTPRPAILESDCSMAIKHVKREHNVIAHELAHLARRLHHSAVWRDRCPACVESLVAQDCKLLSN